MAPRFAKGLVSARGAPSCKVMAAEAEPRDLVLIYLRRIDEKVDALRQDVIELKERVGRVEREIANLHGDFASLAVRMDRLELPVERIERRLDIVPA